MIDKILVFFDVYNKIFAVASLGVIGLTLIFDAPLAVAVAIFTAVYAFIAFNRMRESENIWMNSPAVRREFQSETDSENYDFGLKNFGPGPALYLRVHATVEPDGPDLTIHESDLPLHLEEGEFLSLLRGELAELRDEDSELYKQNNAKKVELYYTFESTSGGQIPIGLTEPRKMSVKELVDKVDDPRTEKLENLQRDCAESSEIIEKRPL